MCEKKPRKFKRWYIVIIVIVALVAVMMLKEVVPKIGLGRVYETIEQAIDSETHTDGDVKCEIVDNFYIGAVFSDDSFHTFAGVITDNGYRPLTGEPMKTNVSGSVMGKIRNYDYNGKTLVCFAASMKNYETITDQNKNLYSIIESEDGNLQFVYCVYDSVKMPEVIEIYRKTDNGWEEIRSIYP